MISFDWDKAFDRLSIPRTLRSLLSHGVPRWLVRKLVPLLTGRQVKILTLLGNSRWFAQRLGVTQGSILGPLLWCESMRPLLDLLQDNNTIPRAFADDLLVEVHGHTLSDLEVRGNVVATTVAAWALNNFQPLSSKSSVMLCSMHLHDHGLDLNIHAEHPRLLQVHEQHGDDLVGLPLGWFWRRSCLVIPGDIPSVVHMINGERIHSPSDFDRAWRRGDVNCIVSLPLLRSVAKLPVLGVCLEPQLTFAEHIHKITVAVEKLLGLLQRLSGTTWRPSYSVMRVLVLSHLCSRMDYASPAWAPLCSSTLRDKLRRLDAKIARIALGLGKSSHLFATHYDSMLIPFDLRLAIQLLSIACVAASRPTTCLSTLLSSPVTIPGKPRPGFRGVLQECLRDLELQRGDLAHCPSFASAPPQVVHWHVHPGRHLPRDLIHQHALRHLSDLDYDYAIWTDGSLFGSRGGAGAINSTTGDKAWLLLCASSSTWSELYGISLGLWLASSLPASTVALFVDSKAALQQLENGRLLPDYLRHWLDERAHPSSRWPVLL